MTTCTFCNEVYTSVPLFNRKTRNAVVSQKARELGPGMAMGITVASQFTYHGAEGEREIQCAAQRALATVYNYLH